MTGADPLLLSRLMKHLAAMGVITEHACDQYLPSNLSQALAHPKYADGFPCFAKGAMNAIYGLPEYLARINYRNPGSGLDSPFQFAYGTTKHWFEWAAENPPVLSQFGNHMSAYHQGRPSWMDPDFYPIEDNLLTGVDIKPHDVLLVDVGGSLGHDLEELLDKHPTIPGRLILQDLPAVIQQARNYNGRIEPMAHDFFSVQPVKGARVYYLHSVLHDWPDKDCKLILQRITAAMTPGHSKLLINENVVPDVGADWQITALDFMVMTLVKARERNQQDWRRLLESAGLRILKIWSHENGIESLIECELA
ncbi:hypothetical protein Plec18167_006163 [Paecilomyces lecythidis]|uniref:O-methyltransferase C-terminal domain-containing protein n=1 Tax=Paecilomyces lecythidis TaxID=3004212 RepID=A0ABR3XCL0_9EURO